MRNSESKNKFESFIYTAKEYLGEELYRNHTTELAVQELEKLCEDNDDWLYSDEARASNYTVFDSKYNEMYEIVRKVMLRIE